MSTFFSWWVIVITLVNIFACWWLIRWTMKKRPDESATGDVTGHVWDGLEEYNNPLPRWWLWSFYATAVFALIGTWLRKPLPVALFFAFLWELLLGQAPARMQELTVVFHLGCANITARCQNVVVAADFIQRGSFAETGDVGIFR